MADTRIHLVPSPLEPLVESVRATEVTDHVWSVAIIAGALLVGATLARLGFRLISRWAHRTESAVDDAVLRHLRRPIHWLVPLVLLRAVLPLVVLPEVALRPIRHVLAIALIAAGGWLAMRMVKVVETITAHRYATGDTDDLRARAVQTQIRGFRNIAGFLILVVTIAAALMTFESVRQLGVTLLASAGVAGIIIGFAAQRSIATLIAGVQIAMTQPIRVDDVVIVEGEWGRIEEIRLTYVVVRIWDLRRLIVPVTYFLEKPFQNWTRTTSELLGTVFLYVDYTVPVGAVRAELERIVRASERWDGNACGLQVTNTTERTVELRALISAADASAAWELRCEVREKLLAWLHEHHPGCLPRVRADVDQDAGRDAPERAAG